MSAKRFLIAAKVTVNETAVSFNEVEQRLLRFLKEEFLKKGSKPTTMHDPATMERDVTEKLGLDLSQYREIMARFEHHGIAKAIAVGAINGHVQIDPLTVDIVRQLDQWVAYPAILVRAVRAIAGFLSAVGTIIGLILKWFGG